MNTTVLNGDVGDEQEHVDRQFNPVTSSLTNSQARELAVETGICSDGLPCGHGIPCDECPNYPKLPESSNCSEIPNGCDLLYRAYRMGMRHDINNGAAWTGLALKTGCQKKAFT